MKKLNYNRYSSSSLSFSTPAAFVGVGVLTSSLLFYIFTLAPSVIWGDSAGLTLMALKMHLSLGADSHPLFIILGRLFSHLPFEPAYSLNLLSAVTASLSVLCVYLIIFNITESMAASIIGAVALALSHAFWLHAVIAEVYDLNAFFVALIILILLKWREKPSNYSLLYPAVFSFGLGLSNHLVMALTAFGFIFIVLITDFKGFFKLKVLLPTVCSFLTGSSILIYLFIKKLLIGHTTAVMIDAATGGYYKKAMLTLSIDILNDIFMYFSYLFYQFPLIGFLLGFIGFFALFKKRRNVAIFLLLLIVVNMLFFITFGPGTKNTTKYTFYISDYAIFSIFIGYGFFALNNYLTARDYSPNKIFLVSISLVILLPLFLYNITPYASNALGIDLLHARTIPYRDNEVFFLNPNKRGYTGAARYAEEAFSYASPGSIIVADHTPSKVLEYFQRAKGIRKDVLIVNSGYLRQNIPYKIVSTYYGKRDIYLADMERGYYRIRDLKNDYDFVPAGVLYKILRKSNS
jgi:hypothetical protein